MYSLQLKLKRWLRRRDSFLAGRCKRNCVILMIIVQILTLTPLTWGDPAWLQVCDDSHQFQLNSLDCNIGLWLKKPMKIECVCINGVWALTEGFCDPRPLILVGDGDCFSVRKPVRSIKLIGNSDSPFAPATYVVSPDFSTFTKVPEHGFNTEMETSSSLIISINPKSAFMRQDEQVCVKVPASKLTKPVHIWQNSRRQSTRFTQVDEKNCQENENSFEKHIDFGESYQSGSINPVELTMQKCSHKCPTHPEKNGLLSNSKAFNSQPLGCSLGDISLLSPQLKSGQGSSSRSKIIWKELFALNRKLTFTGGSQLSAQELEKRKLIYLERFKISEAKIEFRREIREQTVRMAQAHLNYALLGQPTVQINTKEYIYFEKARKVFTSILPLDLAPRYVVNGLMRMWRQLLWESHDKFAYRDTIPEPQHLRIVEALDKCFLNVSTLPMVFVDWKNTSSHPCLNNTNVTYWNRSWVGPSPKLNLWVYLSFSNPPSEVVFDESKYDFVVELAWKIVIHAQHHCSSWFERNAQDYSTMSSKLDSLFNPKVIKRWNNPEDSLMVYQKLFPGVDFRTIGFSADRVAEAARDYSSQQSQYQLDGSTGFPHWLRRPRIPISKIDLRPNRKPRPKNNQRLRRSLGSHKTKRKFWDSKAFCMDKFLDPVKFFQYEPPPDCLINEPGA